MDNAVRSAASKRGFTLVELLVATAVLTFISLLIYGAFSGLQRSKDGVTRINDRYHEGRGALQRIAFDLQAAYLSAHVPLDRSQAVVQTGFVAESGSPADKLSFNAFVNRRLDENVRQSDQAEISYSGAAVKGQSGVIDLLRRLDPSPDLEPEEGGRVEVLATDIDLLDLQYLDPLTGLWQERWDTTQALTGQPNRLPLQVKVTLVLNGGSRAGSDSARDKITLKTKIMPQIREALSFALR